MPQTRQRLIRVRLAMPGRSHGRPNAGGSGRGPSDPVVPGPADEPGPDRSEDGILLLESFQVSDKESLRKLVVASQVAMALGRTQFSRADGTRAASMPTAPRMM